MKKAFTLAEVLITLGIIGVVAAITMPTVINKFQETVTINKVKKFYSMLNQAVQLSKVHNGEVYDWSLDNPDKAAEYIEPYLKVTNSCSYEQYCVTQPYRGLNNSDVSFASSHVHKTMLADGSYFWFMDCHDAYNVNRGMFLKIWYDINGEKAPNVYGKDLFHFHLYNGKIIPADDNDCNLTKTGYGCAKNILIDGNMDYLHK